MSYFRKRQGLHGPAFFLRDSKLNNTFSKLSFSTPPKSNDFDKQADYRPDNILLQSTLNYVAANLTQLAILVIRFSGEDHLMAGVRPLVFSSTFFDYL
jgi:hypothetical protein